MAFGKAKKRDEAEKPESEAPVEEPKRELSKAERKRERKAANLAAAEKAAENAEGVAEKSADAEKARQEAKERAARRRAGQKAKAEAEGEEKASSKASSSPHRGGKKPSPKRRHITLVCILIIILALCVGLSWTPDKTIKQGLDVQGGLSVIMTASHPDGSAVSTEEMDEAIAIVTNRVNSLGASEATVQADGSDMILVQIPGVEDPDQALATIGTTGTLEFVDLRDITDANASQMIAQGYSGFSLEPGTYTPFMTGDSINNVTIGQESRGSAYYSVNLDLDGQGTQAFADVSTELFPTHGQIAILLDGVVQSAPAVQSAITNGQVSITGKYTIDDAKNLKTILDSGALPVTLTFSESRVVGPTLGQESLHAAVLAAGVGMALVIVYLLFFYMGLGILTAANMLVFGILYLGVLAGLSRMGVFALSLSGLAGIVLTIGMAADSSILVLERFREEIRMGRSIRAAAQTGVRHGILTSIDADVVSLISGIVLFAVAAGAVKGFGLTLTLGILIDIATMLLFKAPVIRLLAPKAITNNPGFWGLKADQAEAVARGAGSNDVIAPKLRGKAAETQAEAEEGGVENA